MFFLSCLFVNLILINGLKQEDDFIDSKRNQLTRLGFNHIFWSTINSTDLETINISAPCVDSFKSAIEITESGQQWSNKLLESSGNFPINTGYSDFGDYDSCLSVHWSDEVGKHCTISLLPTLNESEWSVNPWTHNKMIDIEHEAVLKIGLCIPSKCSKTDLVSILTLTLKPDHWHLIKVDQCIVKLSLRQKLSESNLHQKLSLIFLFAIFFINLYATWIDWSFQSSKYRWTRYFSLMRNYNQLITSNVSPRSDFITKFGIIVHWYTLTAHIAFIYIFLGGWSLFDNKFLQGRMIFSWSVEILFVYGGLTRSLELWRVTGQSTSIVSSFKHLIIKMLYIIILQLSLLMVILIRPLIVEGPMSSIFNDDAINDCKKSFWSNLIFWQNNYRPVQEMCTSHTWSVALEFQLLPLIIGLIHLYKRKPKLAVTFNSLIVVCGLIYVTFHTQIKYLVLSTSLNLNSIRTLSDFMESTYLPTSMHIWIYLMGPLWTYLIMSNHPLIEQLRKISLVKVFIALSIVPFICIKLTNYYNGAILNFILGFNYRLLIILFYSIIIMANSQQLKSFFHNPMDRNWSNSNQIKDKINTTIDSANNQANQRFLHFVSNLLRSTYFIHVALIVAIYAIQRQPIVTFSSFIMISIKLLVVSLFGGFIFHLTVANPVNNLISSIGSKRKTT